jgi:pantoate--beta-alanine ligase
VLVLDVPPAMRAWSGQRRQAGHIVGLVPTMGALHDGHLSLIELALRRADDVVVSIFVNPLQFDVTADFARYPRPIDDDVAACTTAGVAAVYAPTADAMYPAGFQTRVEPGALATVMEGAMRPGHFSGVTTVVAKLFGAVRPHLAVFGEKDFQQLVIVRRMSDDLDMGVEIVPAPIVREPDGLALSSRNRLLTIDDRAAAACVPAALEAAAATVAAGERVAAEIEAAARAVVVAEPRARLEYVTAFDPDTLDPLETIDAPARIATAVWFGDVRLIDNRELLPSEGLPSSEGFEGEGPG